MGFVQLEGRALQSWVSSLLKSKGVRSFGDFRTPDGERLQILVSDLSQRRLLVLPRDSEQLGIDPDELEISYAVRMSMSLPVAFEPVVHNNPLTGEDHVLVDGTILSNVPVFILDVPGIPRCPTFGVRVTAEPRSKLLTRGRQGALPVAFEVITAAAEFHERLELASEDQVRTIDIPALGTDPLNFDLPREQALELISAAHSVTDEFLDGWDFAAYVERYRGREQVPAGTRQPVGGGSDEDERHIDLVLDASAARSLALTEALSSLAERGFYPRRVVGASGGALVGSLFAAGYAPAEIGEVLASTPMSDFRDAAWEDRAWEFDEGVPIGLGILRGKRRQMDEPLGVESTNNVDERHIAAWIAERPSGDTRPLLRGQAYSLSLRVGAPMIGTLLGDIDAVIPAADVPEEGLDTRWTLSSEQVELRAGTPGMTVERRTFDGVTLFRASFELRIPHRGDSDVIGLTVVPAHLPTGRIEITIEAHGEPYREVAIDLDVDEGVLERREQVPVEVLEQDVITAAAHLGVQAPHEWQTPDARLAIRVGRDSSASVAGDVRTAHTIEAFEADVPWRLTVAEVAGLIENVRGSTERLRTKHDFYLNDIEPNDLDQRLNNFVPVYDWANAPALADADHEARWQEVLVSDELRRLAFDGHKLYQRVFPDGQPDQPLRQFVDAMLPGDRLDISWTSTAEGIVPHIPWGLMYVNNPDDPIDAMAFLGLRLRLGYRAYRTPTALGRALGAPESAWRAHVLYWGGQPNDPTAAEAERQRQIWNGVRDVCVPADGGPEARSAVLAALRRPQQSPTTVLHLFCRCDVGDGNEVALQFGSTNAPEDVLLRFDLPNLPLEDRPLVFANACGTSASNPYYLNELERGFFDRGARAFIGTETRVPPVLAGRFASIFFHFFTRKADPLPMAAGEALAQARLFLWSNYRNLGGLLYAYINQFELYLAEDAEVLAMRR